MLRILSLAFALGASAAPLYSGSSSDVSGYETGRKCAECVKAEDDLIKAIEAHDDASSELNKATNAWTAAASDEAGELLILDERKADTAKAKKAYEDAVAAQERQDIKHKAAQKVTAAKHVLKNDRQDDVDGLVGPLAAARATAARECAEMRGEQAETTTAAPTTTVPPTTRAPTTTAAPTTVPPKYLPPDTVFAKCNGQQICKYSRGMNSDYCICGSPYAGKNWDYHDGCCNSGCGSCWEMAGHPAPPSPPPSPPNAPEPFLRCKSGKASRSGQVICDPARGKGTECVCGPATAKNGHNGCCNMGCGTCEEMAAP